MDYHSFMAHAFRPAVTRLGMKDVSFHTLRHTTASLLISEGAPITAVAGILGHASTQMTLDVTSYIDKLIVATSLHRTILVNMARQWWLKGHTAGVSLDNFFHSVNSDVRIFAEMIVRQGRQKNSQSRKYFEVYRVIDDANVVSTLSKLGEK